jgi:hypothetical protein
MPFTTGGACFKNVVSHQPNAIRAQYLNGYLVPADYFCKSNSIQTKDYGN